MGVVILVVVMVALTTVVATALATPTPSPTPSPLHHKFNINNVIGAIVIGSMTFGLVLGAVICICVKKYLNRRQYEPVDI